MGQGNGHDRRPPEVEGSLFAIARSLGELGEGFRNLRNDLWMIYDRLEIGESRMDFLGEENARRASETQALREAATRQLPDSRSPWTKLAHASKEIVVQNWGMLCLRLMLVIGAYKANVAPEFIHMMLKATGIGE